MAALLVEDGRSERIRTSDPLYPKQVRYQAAPRSDEGLFSQSLDELKAPEFSKARQVTNPYGRDVSHGFLR